MRNKYPGPCRECSGRVEAGEGYFERSPGGWLVRCILCTAKSKIAAGKPLSRAQAKAAALSQASPTLADGGGE